MKKKYFSIGKILNTRGILGELKVQSWMDAPEDFCLVSKMFLNLNEAPLDIVSMKVYKSNIIMKIKSITNKTQAEILKNKILYAYKEDIPIKEGNYFIEELKGCMILDSAGKKVYGVLKDIINNGATDIYIIEDENKREYLLPIIEGTISNINLDEEKIYINPIKGVFDDN